MRIRGITLIAGTIAALSVAGMVGAQVALNAVQLSDLKANGTALGYFHKSPSVKAWNFTGVTAPSVSGTTLTVPGPVQYGTSSARPTCASGLRGEFYTIEMPNNGGNADGGIKDLTYQCCKAVAGTYSWVAGYCQ